MRVQITKILVYFFYPLYFFTRPDPTCDWCTRFLLDKIEAGRYGSKVLILNGKDGEVLFNSSYPRLDWHTYYTQDVHNQGTALPRRCPILPYSQEISFPHSLLWIGGIVTGHTSIKISSAERL